MTDIAQNSIKSNVWERSWLAVESGVHSPSWMEAYDVLGILDLIIAADHPKNLAPIAAAQDYLNGE